MTDSDIQNTPFVKQLAANDRPTRDAAVASLKSYLSAKRTFTRLDFLKLWKGLFYCMWMSDRPRTQQNLATELASLVDGLQEENYILFMDVFWSTMAREWSSIDVLRMDKFLLLVRRYLESSFRYLHKRDWDEEMTTKYIHMMNEVPLNPTNPKIPNGLRYHLIDIYVDELEKFYSTEQSTPTGKEISPPIQLLMKPFEILVMQSPTKVVRTRVKELLADERLQTWGYQIESRTDDKADANGQQRASTSHGSNERAEEEEWTGFDD